MTIIRSVAYGYVGAVLAGAVAAMVGMLLGLSEQSVVAAAAPAGLVIGTIGLCLPWRHAIAARVRALRGRRDPRDPGGRSGRPGGPARRL